MNKINDRDLTELGGYWVYQDIDDNDIFKVNGKKFRVVDSFDDSKESSNSNGGTDIKTVELLDDKNHGTGQQTIIFQGTDNNESINPNNPLKGKVADDWLQNIKLMNNRNKKTELIEQNHNYVKNYQQKIYDAKHLKNVEFFKKYGLDSSKYKNKTIINSGGNSQGAVGAKYEGVKNPNLKVATTDPATLPEASWRGTKPGNHNNIINFHSTYDILSWAQDSVFKNNPGKRVDIENGVPTLEALADSHLGYKRKFNKKDNTYKDIPVRKIKSVKDTVTKDGKKVSKTINIKLDMDGRIPINVWTGESIARSGSGKLIKLDIEKLGNLEQLVTGETSRMLSECVTFLNESFNISQKENSNFGERKHKLKRDFIDKIRLETLENFCNKIKSERKYLESIIDKVLLILSPLMGALPSLDLKLLEERISSIVKNLERGIEAIHDTADNVLSDLFKNLDHDFADGVSEEMMKHLEIVSKNITQVKNQNDIYGRQIGDIKSIMSQQDATIMDGNTNINYSGENMVSGTIQPSNYLTRKMTILRAHIDNAIKKLSENIQDIYNEYFKPIIDDIDFTISAIYSIKYGIDSILSALDTAHIKTLVKLLPTPASVLTSYLEVLKHYLLDKWVPLLTDLQAASPILENHLGEIITNTKPMIVNMIFEPSHYDDMFILNKAAQGRLDQMSQQFEVVCNGLNENEGQAIKTMDDSASLIRSNMNKVKNQLEKIAVY
ncbi:hypothetical protein WL278_09610 [Staphylococcus caprae]|uniref:hypothetical protein n=1 Tax=Staphylococcus TaxID=1279 RepID=UPI0008A8D9BE|nr:hypothetical protein [Staphylococcus sp. HMSC62A08]OHS41045.1 hypothetical protein HMPREF3264_00845 [Staphylococcus sp. HMSC62A08]